jgi:hypothetical protein
MLAITWIHVYGAYYYTQFLRIQECLYMGLGSHRTAIEFLPGKIKEMLCASVQSKVEQRS